MSGALIIGIALVGILVDVCALKVADAADEKWQLREGETRPGEACDNRDDGQ